MNEVNKILIVTQETFIIINKGLADKTTYSRTKYQDIRSRVTNCANHTLCGLLISTREASRHLLLFAHLVCILKVRKTTFKIHDCVFRILTHDTQVSCCGSKNFSKICASTRIRTWNDGSEDRCDIHFTMEASNKYYTIL